MVTLALAGQLAFHATMPESQARRRTLPTPPPKPVLRTAALGEPSALAAAGCLWVQFFDDQAGVSVPYERLDYARLRRWLERLLALEPASDYPLLLAVRLYARVDDAERTRAMLDFVHRAVPARPRERWRWLAEAAVTAEHGLGDRELALRFAETLAAHTAPGEIPHWARDLRLLLLEDMGRYRAAKILIGGMLESGAINDPAELHFLRRRLEALKARSGAGDRSGS
jgi:hypothetical protein